MESSETDDRLRLFVAVSGALRSAGDGAPAAVNSRGSPLHSADHDWKASPEGSG